MEMLPIHIHRTHTEVLSLLIEARNYATHLLYEGKNPTGDRNSMYIAYESIRVTTRLSHVMSWVLALKAVNNGEISYADILAHGCDIPGQNLCVSPGGSDDQRLPPGLRSLLERSHRLYVRVQRLDALIRGDGGQAQAVPSARLH